MTKLKSIIDFYSDETRRVLAGVEFDVFDTVAKELQDRGLAAPVALGPRKP